MKIDVDWKMEVWKSDGNKIMNKTLSNTFTDSVKSWGYETDEAGDLSEESDLNVIITITSWNQTYKN